MSIMHFDAMPAATDNLELALSGGFASDLDSFSATAGFRFTAAGFSYKLQGGSTTLMNSDTDWITPRTSFDPADYEIRWHEDNVIIEEGPFGSVTVNTSTGWNEDTFLALDSTRQVQYAVDDPYSKFPVPEETILGIVDVSLTFEIRYQDGLNTFRNPLTSAIDAANVAEIGTFYTIFLQAF